MNTITRSVGGEISVGFVGRPSLPDELAEIVFERDSTDQSVG
jgi:hypothetical protein